MSLPVDFEFNQLMEEVRESPSLPRIKQNRKKQTDQERANYFASNPKKDYPLGWDWEKQRVEETTDKPSAATARKLLESYQRGCEWYNCIRLNKRVN